MVEKEFGELDSITAPFFNEKGIRDGRLSVTTGRQTSEVVGREGFSLTPNAQLIRRWPYPRTIISPLGEPRKYVTKRQTQ